MTRNLDDFRVFHIEYMIFKSTQEMFSQRYEMLALLIKIELLKLCSIKLKGFVYLYEKYYVNVYFFFKAMKIYSLENMWHVFLNLFKLRKMSLTDLL